MSPTQSQSQNHLYEFKCKNCYKIWMAPIRKEIVQECSNCHDKVFSEQFDRSVPLAPSQKKSVKRLNKEASTKRHIAKKYNNAKKPIIILNQEENRHGSKSTSAAPYELEEPTRGLLNLAKYLATKYKMK